MRYSILLVLIWIASGCVSTYKQEVITAPSGKLQRGKSVLIATPSNGFYEGKEYSESGRATAMAVRSAFARYSSNIVVSTECRDLDCLKSKHPTSLDYYVVPEILHWEDRATEWSGIKDKLEIKMAVYDARDGSEISASIISGKSKWMTFGGDHPQDLLAEPMNKHIASLY